jgi:hypothetical protein
MSNPKAVFRRTQQGWTRAEGGEELSKDEDGRRIRNTHFDSGDMGTLVDLDSCDLLDGGIPGCETGSGEVGRLEFAQSLLVEFRLEIFEDGCEI